MGELVANIHQMPIAVEVALQEIMHPFEDQGEPISKEDLRARLEDYRLTDEELGILSLAAMYLYRQNHPDAGKLKYREYHSNPINLSQIIVTLEPLK